MKQLGKVKMTVKNCYLFVCEHYNMVIIFIEVYLMYNIMKVIQVQYSDSQYKDYTSFIVYL